MKHIPAQVEPERYEFAAPPSYIFELDRREGFQLLGAGALGVSAVMQSAPAESGRGGAGSESSAQDIEPCAHICEDGKVSDPQSKRSIGYAALVKGQQLTQSLPAEDPLIPAAKWTVLARSAPKIDGRDFVTGRHRYPSDQQLPEMWYGKVLRPPSF